MSTEAKVGMFFLIAVLIAGVIAGFLGDAWGRARSYAVTAHFANVGGLAKGAEVRQAGVKIGRVTEIKLENDPNYPRLPAAVKMSIYRDAFIYTTDEYQIQMGALLGDKYVEVKPIEVTPKYRVLNNGHVVGGEIIGIEQMTKNVAKEMADPLIAEARQTLAEARLTLRDLRATLTTDFNKKALTSILTNVMSATAKADVLASQAMRLAAILTRETQKASPNLQRLAANMTAASESVRNTAELVRATLATSSIPRDAAIATSNLRDATQDLSAISESFAQVLATPETRGKMESALSNMHQATANLAKITGETEKLLSDGSMGADMKQALAKLRESADHLSNIAETYDKVLTDPKFTADLQGTMSAAREAAETGARTLQKAETSLDRVDQTLDKVSRVSRQVAPTAVRYRGSLETPRKSSARVDADVDLQYGSNPNSFWRVGVRDAGDRNGVNLQRSIPLGRDRARVGLIGGQPGVAYDVNPGGNVSLEAEAWNPDDTRFDLRGGVKMTPQLEALFGLYDIGDRNDPFVGVRYRSKP